MENNYAFVIVYFKRNILWPTVWVSGSAYTCVYPFTVEYVETIYPSVLFPTESGESARPQPGGRAVPIGPFVWSDSRKAAIPERVIYSQPSQKTE